MTQNGYDFYLDGCLLPVTPQKLEMKINNGNKTITDRKSTRLNSSHS